MTENKNPEEKVVNILVVDDEEIIRDLFKRFLPDGKTCVYTAPSGEKALEIAKEKPLDLVFLDIRMPGMNGLQTFRELKKINPDITCAMMTGYADQDLIDNALNEGAIKCLKKPFEDITDVRNILSQVSVDKKKKTVNLLVVDDDNVFLDLFSRAPLSLQSNVSGAKDKKEALEALNKEKFDVVFLDIKLGEDSGLEVYEEIRKLYPDTPVIITTAYSDEKSKEIDQARNEGIFGVIPKPFDIEVIKNVIFQIMKRKAGK